MPLTLDEMATTKKSTFDPEGKGYDIETAKRYGLQPNIEDHWQSRIPETGLLLKGRGHETWHKTVEGEEKAGYEIYKGADGRYYSRLKKRDLTLDEMSERPKEVPEAERGMRLYPPVQSIFDDDIPEYQFEDYLPIDIQNDVRRLIEESDNPDETRAKIMNSMYYSQKLDVPPTVTFDLVEELNKLYLGEEKITARPGKLFAQSFMQSMLDKPAMMLRGVQVYTPGTAKGADALLEKASTYIQSLKDPTVAEKLAKARAGKLWPIAENAKWYQVDSKYLPEVINAWATNIGDQIPIMLATLAGRAMGKIVGRPIGAAAGVAAAAITAGPELTDIATAPIVASVTSEIIKHLGGAAPLVAMEAGNYMDEASALGIDKDIAEKYARIYGLGSGAIEYAQWLWVLSRYAKLTKPMQRTIMKLALTHIGGSAIEGLEEISQEGLQNKLLQVAVAEMKERHPDYEGVAPETWEGWKRSGAIGSGVAFITGMPGTGMTMAQGRMARREIIKPETKEPLEAKPTPEIAEKPSEAVTPTEPATVEDEGRILGSEVVDRFLDKYSQNPIEIAKGKISFEIIDKEGRDVDLETFALDIGNAVEDVYKTWVTQGEKAGREHLAEEMRKLELIKHYTIPEHLDELETSIANMMSREIPLKLPEAAPVVSKPKPAEAKEPWEITTKEYVKEKSHDYLGQKGITEDQGLAYKHINIVKKAVEEDKHVPRNVLETVDIKDKKWAQEALAKEKPAEAKKIPTEPISVRMFEMYEAGTERARAIQRFREITEEVKRKRPQELRAAGLTKAELKIVSTQVATEMREAQKILEPVGYRRGYHVAAEKGRAKLSALLAEEKITHKSREDARKAIQELLPSRPDKEQHARFLARLGNVKTPKAAAKLIDEVNEFVEKWEHRKAVGSFKRAVKKIRREYRRGEVALGRLPDKVRDKLLTVLEKYDTATLTEEKAEELQKHEDHIQAVAGSLAEAIKNWESLGQEGEYILETPRRRIEQLERLSKTPIAELTTDEIETLEDELLASVGAYETKRQHEKRIGKEELHTDITQTANEVRGKKLLRTGAPREPGTVKKFIHIAQAQLRTLVSQMSAKENDHFMKLVVDDVLAGWRQRAEDVTEWCKYTIELIEKAEISDKNFNKLDDSIRIKINGKSVTTTYDVLLSFWMNAEAEGNLRPILITRGFRFSDSKGRTIETGPITLLELQKALAKLPEKLKSLGRTAFRVNKNKQAPAINRTTIKERGYPIARKSRYWALHRYFPKQVRGPRTDVSHPIEVEGRYQERKGGSQILQIVPFTRQFISGIQLDATLHGTTMAMRNVRTLLANSKFRKRIRDAGQDTVLRGVIGILEKSQRLATSQNVIEEVFGKLIPRAGRGILALRLSGSLIQTASVPAAQEVIDSKHFIGIKPTTPKMVSKLKEISGVLWMRWRARQVDYALGSAAARNAFNTLIRNKTSLPDKATKHYIWGDQFAIGQIWQASQAQIKAETNLKLGSDEFQKASLNLLYRALETQPQWDMIHRPDLFARSGAFVRGLTIFMSARNAQYNVLSRAYFDWKQERISSPEMLRRISGVIEANVLVEVMRKIVRWGTMSGALALLLGIKDDPAEEQDLIDAAKDIAKEDIIQIIPESAYNLFGLVAVGHVVELLAKFAINRIKGKKWQRSPLEGRPLGLISQVLFTSGELFASTLDFTKDILTQETYAAGKRKGELRWHDSAIRMINNTGEVLSYTLGTPWSGPVSDIVWPVKRLLRKAGEEEEFKGTFRR